MQETHSFRNSKIQQGNKLSGYWAHIFLYFFVVLLSFWRDINPQHHNEHLQLAPIGLVSSPSTCQVYVFTGPRVPRSPAGTKNKQWTNRWIAFASTELGLRLFRIKSVQSNLNTEVHGITGVWIPVFNSGWNIHPQASTHSFGFLSICPTGPQGVSLVFTMEHATLAIPKNKESESWSSQKKWCSSVHPHFQTQRQPLCRSTNLKQVALKMSVAALPCLLHKCLINEVPTPATAPDSWWRLVAVWRCPPLVPPSRWRFFSKTFFSFSVSNLWTCFFLSGSC